MARQSVIMMSVITEYLFKIIAEENNDEEGKNIGEWWREKCDNYYSISMEHRVHNRTKRIDHQSLAARHRVSLRRAVWALYLHRVCFSIDDDRWFFKRFPAVCCRRERIYNKNHTQASQLSIVAGLNVQRKLWRGEISPKRACFELFFRFFRFVEFLKRRDRLDSTRPWT